MYYKSLLTVLIICITAFCQLSDSEAMLFENFEKEKKELAEKKIQDSILSDSLRIGEIELANMKKDEIQKLIYVENQKIDSLTKDTANLNKVLYKDKLFKRMRESGMDMRNKKAYGNFLLENHQKDTASVINWFKDYYKVVELEYQILYTLMNLKEGNTKANIYLHTRPIQNKMEEIATIIREFELDKKPTIKR